MDNFEKLILKRRLSTKYYFDSLSRGSWVRCRYYFYQVLAPDLLSVLDHFLLPPWRYKKDKLTEKWIGRLCFTDSFASHVVYLVDEEYLKASSYDMVFDSD